MVMGMGLALTSEITFKNGRAEQNNFDGYEITRIDAAPKEIGVHLLPTGDYDEPLGGVGEPGVPPVAPAHRQRDLRRDRPAHPAIADLRSAQRLNRQSHRDALGGRGETPRPRH